MNELLFDCLELMTQRLRARIRYTLECQVVEICTTDSSGGLPALWRRGSPSSENSATH